MAVSPDFRYWNSVEPSSFLEHDWENPSREWAAVEAINAALKGDGSLLEVGPGPGIDYERHFREATTARILHYSAFEGSLTLYESLRGRFPEATWRNLTIADLPPLGADVVYARHVLEHQPNLEPAFGALLSAARRVVVLTWYRPPGDTAFGEVWAGVYCQTYARAEVLGAVKRRGFRIAASQAFDSGDECWILERA